MAALHQIRLHRRTRPSSRTGLVSVCGLIVLLRGVGAAASAADLPFDFKLPPPPGRAMASKFAPADGKPGNRAQFESGKPVVTTTYFYWYDAKTKAHIVDGDGSDALTDHPPTLAGFSYHNVDWHRRELADMAAAGIDVALPVYWGAPVGTETWSDLGLPPLVAARNKLLAAGATPPVVGMFYDTSTLQHNGGGYHVDLTSPQGKLWFYGTIRNFFSLVPAEHRARIDGKPLVFLYTRAFAKDVDETLFPDVRKMFQADFGSDLYLVKMADWPGPADSEYSWGGALAPQILATAGIGPGYDHSAVPGRAPLVRRRDDGRFYQFAWSKILRLPREQRPWLVHLETWNEFHEGTDICESAEYGRKYIELTRRYADLFHAGQALPAGENLAAPVAVSSTPEKSQGVSIVDKSADDGPIVEKIVAEKRAWSTTQNRHVPDARYMYFDVDYTFLDDGDEALELSVTYFDDGPDSFLVEYDSADLELKGLAQKFRPTVQQEIMHTRTWKEAKFTLPHARFSGRANGCDFRLTATQADLAIASVSLRRAAE